MKRNPLAYQDHCWFWKEPWVILIAVAIVIVVIIVRTIVVLNDGSNNCSKNSRNKNNTDNHNASAALPGCKSPKPQTPKFKSKNRVQALHVDSY